MDRLKFLFSTLLLVSLSFGALADPEIKSKPSSGISLKSSQSTSTLKLNSKGRPNVAQRQSIVILGGKSRQCVTENDGTVHCSVGPDDEGD